MAYILLILTVLFWAGNFILARAIHLDMQPFTLAFMRWGLALVLILPWLLPRLIKNLPVIRQYLPRLLLLSFLGVVCFNTLVYQGVQYTTASNATLMQSAIPIVILVITSLFLGEKAGFRQWVGVFISFCGVVVLVSRGDHQVITSLDFNRGDLWIFGAVMSWALYSVALRWKPAELDGFTFFGFSVLAGVLVLLPLAIYEQGGVPLLELRSDIMMTVFYMAVFPSILSFIFWNKGVAELGAPTAGLFIHLMPLFGMALSVLFLGESVYLYQLVGILLIFTGIYLAVVAQTLKRLQKHV